MAHELAGLRDRLRNFSLLIEARVIHVTNVELRNTTVSIPRNSSEGDFRSLSVARSPGQADDESQDSMNSLMSE